MLFNPSVADVRRYFCNVWKKHQQGTPLEPLEMVALQWIGQHPEYHDELADLDRALEADYSPEAGRSNPFLHLSLHLAISEQRGIDQPRGIRQAMDVLEAKLGSAHDAAHVVQECLVEALWQSQRHGRPLDGNAYVNAVRQKAGLPPMPPDYSAGPGGHGRWRQHHHPLSATATADRRPGHEQAAPARQNAAASQTSFIPPARPFGQA